MGREEGSSSPEERAEALKEANIKLGDKARELEAQGKYEEASTLRAQMATNSTRIRALLGIDRPLQPKSGKNVEDITIKPPKGKGKRGKKEPPL